MTKHIFTLIFFLIIATANAQYPKWKLTTSAGIDFGGAVPIPLSEMPKDAEATFKIRPTLGIGMQRNFNEHWSLGVESNYHIIAIEANVNVVSQAFWADDRSYAMYFSGEAYSSTELQFVEIPITAYYHFNKRWSLVFGGYFSIITKGEMETEGKNGWISADKNDTDTAPLPGTQSTSFDFNDELDNYDAGALLGYEFKLGKRLSMFGRFNVGFKSIFKPEFNNIDYEMYQFRFSTGVSFILWKDLDI
jgi:hypothetical protein